MFKMNNYFCETNKTISDYLKFLFKTQIYTLFDECLEKNYKLMLLFLILEKYRNKKQKKQYQTIVNSTKLK